ncbi:MAG: FkbM family methyltransferase [Minisyncoccia bacterium]
MNEQASIENKVLLAYKKIAGRRDWYETRSLSWQERLRRYPFLTLRYALIDRFWKILIGLRLHGPLLSARTFWGDSMEVTFPDYRCIYHEGLIDGRELPVEDFLVHFLKEGDVCIDVGANIGFYTLLTSALVGESGKVYAFEPTPRTFQILSRNSSDKMNVTRVNAALMESEGKGIIADYGVLMSGLNTVLEDPAEAPDGISVLPIDTTTLDAYCKKNGIVPSFIKIDAEGAEESVLTGGVETLTAHYPILIIEVQREAPQEVVRRLETLGYRAYQFSGNTPVPYAIGEKLLCPNMLFMHTSGTTKR